LHLCEEQQKDASIQVSVFSAKGKSAMFSSFEEKTIRIYAGKFTSALKINASAKKEYRELMAQFDIIHFHSFNPVLASLAKKSGKKIVYTEHGNFGIGRKAKINDLAVRWLQKRFLNNSVHAITFNSNFTKDLSVSRFGLRKTKQAVIYNGVPENNNTYSEKNVYRKSADEFLIASVGRLARVKRFDRILNAIKKIENLDFRFVIMGTGPEEIELRSQAEKMELSAKVNFAGQGNSLQLLQESNVCIVSSQGEAFGLVAVEAYQLGKQVLVFDDGGGVTEIVKQLEPFSVAKNEDDMSKIIAQVIQHPETDTANITARKNYAARYTMTAMASKIKELYLSI
jgi:L-malate glycosyltransferase